MSKTLSVEQLIVCEYATQDVQGKFIAAGISAGALIFQGRPGNWPPYKIFVEIKPLSNSIEATVRLFKKSGKTVVSGKYRYRNDILKVPSSIERSFLNLQIPQVPYEGDGIYILEVSEGKRSIARKEFEVSSSSIPSPSLGTVTFEVTEPQTSHSVEYKSTVEIE